MRCLKNNITFFIIIVLFLMSCKGVEMKETKAPELKTLANIKESQLNKLSQAKIYFGHQSVGYNIVDGIKDLTAENSINLNIIETDNPVDLSEPAFAHSQVGRNSYPDSKTDAFKELMLRGFGDNADIAFFKFCYVDIKADSIPQEVFSYYQKTMSSLKTQFPDTVFVHVTTPLIAAPTGAKAFAKKVIKSLSGQPVYGYDDNIKRHAFNELMRTTYAQREPVFDLALFESIQPNGKRIQYSKSNQAFYQLCRQYTDDGGHLNEPGRKRIAEQLIIFLADLI